MQQQKESGAESLLAELCELYPASSSLQTKQINFNLVASYYPLFVSPGANSFYAGARNFQQILQQNSALSLAGG
jgi:hypothetical protein